MNALTSSAVMAQRSHPRGSLDFFPTPPWATRALVHEVLSRYGIIDLRAKRVRDPCAGGGHMAAPLRDSFGAVDVSDVYDWGIDPEIRDFTFETRETLLADGHELPHWIFCNPPFQIASAFLERALSIATEGVAFLCRLGWIAGQERHDTIFGPRPPRFFCPFAERVPMIEGVWDPEASTATDYAWYVWLLDEVSEFPARTEVWHLPPGMEDRYTRESDRALATPGEAARRAAERKKNSASEKETPTLFEVSR